MENRLTVSALASQLADSTGRSKKSCEDFIKEFFKLASEVLASGENLRVKGFGSFKITGVESRMGVNVSTGEPHEIEAHRKVVFTPSKEMATLINLPFEAFESIELDDDLPEILAEAAPAVSKEEIKTSERKSEVQPEETPAPPILEAGSDEEEFDDILTYEAYDEDEEEDDETQPEEEVTISKSQKTEEEVTKAENKPVEEDIETVVNKQIEAETREEPASDENENTPMNNNNENREVVIVKGHDKYGRGFFAGAMTSLAGCLIIFMLGCFFNWWPTNFRSVEKVETIAEAEPASAVVAAQPEPVEEEEIVEQIPATPPTPVAPQSQQSKPEPTATEAAAKIAIPSQVGQQRPTQAKPAAKAPGAAVPNDGKVYDRVSTTRYLTTIAREHYGNFNFWPYIYLENQAILGHPDRITPGTMVVVPPLSKFGVDPKNKEDEKVAKAKGVEIYSRFK